MMNLADAHRYINSFPRPQGFNTYSWQTIKKIAINAWECHLEQKRFNRSINFMCKEFYQMIRTPEGNFIVPENSFLHDHQL